MRNFKKFLTLVLAVMMVVSMVALNTSAAKFTDVDTSNEYLNKAVTLLSNIGVIKGTSETEFSPDELVTREQMAAFIYRLMKKGKSQEGGTNTSTFTDLEDPTFFFMVSWANSQNIIKGTSATTFDPKGSIVLQDAYTMVVRALGYEKEETLPYPFGYIEAAEGEDVELGEGLDSSIAYTDALTRGDVAIILYNAFFAKLGTTSTRQTTIELLGTKLTSTETYYPTFCQKYFDIMEVEYKVTATPTITFGADKTTADLGYEALCLEKVSNDSETKDAPVQVYANFEDLKLEGKADDYIMAHLNLFVALDDDKQIASVYSAESLMEKKTVSEIKLQSKTTTTKSSYFDNDPDNAKLLTGEIVVDGKSAFFFNAPYSYIKPTYTTEETTAVLKYAARNKENLKFIEFKKYDDEEFGYEISDREYYYEHAGNLDAEEIAAGDFAAYALDLVQDLAQVYVGGLYEATFFDVDGNGRYDYVEYLPYRYAIADTDDDYDFEDYDDIDELETLYTNGATLAGESFKDGDFLIGYFNPETNYIKVAAVVAPVTGSIKDINSSDKKVTLSNGAAVSVSNGWKLVSNFDPFIRLLTAGTLKPSDVKFTKFDNLLSSAAYDSKNAEYYVYNDAVLYTKGVKNNVVLDAANVAIITKNDSTGKYVNQTSLTYNDDDEEIISAYAYINGTRKWIKVYTQGKVSGVWPSFGTEGADYRDHVATYTVDGDGIYTLKLLGNAYDDKAMTDDDYIGLSTDLDDLLDDKDETIQVYQELGDEVYFTKSFGKRFYLDSFYDSRLVTLTADTKIILRNEITVDGGDNEVEFLEYNYNTLTNSIEVPLYNVQVVYGNDKSSVTRENLVFLYAETVDAELKSSTTTKADRIIKNIDPKLDENGKKVYYYTVYNPYTGGIEGLYGNKTDAAAKFSRGQIVTVADGKIDEKNDAVGKINGDYSQDWWVLEYDAENHMIAIVTMGDEEGLLGAYTIDVTDTPVTQFTGDQGLFEDMIKYGSFGGTDIAKLGTQPKDLLIRKTNYYKSEKASASTIYMKYISAYIDIDWEDDDFHDITDKNGFNGKANYIVILTGKDNSSDVDTYFKTK